MKRIEKVRRKKINEGKKGRRSRNKGVKMEGEQRYQRNKVIV